MGGAARTKRFIPCRTSKEANAPEILLGAQAHSTGQYLRLGEDKSLRLRGWRPKPGADETVNIPYDIGGSRLK